MYDNFLFSCTRAYYHDPPPPGVNPFYYNSSHPSHHAQNFGAPDYAQQLADSVFGPAPYYYR